MSTRAEILASNRGREPKSPAIYRRGRVNNSAAYYRAAKPQMDKAGRQAKALADFIGAVAKPIGQAVKAEQDEFIEAERNAGIASFTRATPEQRAKMRRAIKNGIISESESPYFREGVSIAYTKNLLSRYNQDLFQRYEAWREKNDPNSGTFDAFLDNFDAEYAPHFETIHEEILVEHFVPGQMGIRRQLQQRHTEHLNKNYRESAEAQLQNTMFDAVNDRANESTVEAVTNGVSYGNAITTGQKNDGVELDELIVMRQAVEDGLTAEEFDKKEQKKKPVRVTSEGGDYSSGSGEFSTKARYKIIGSEVDRSLLKKGEKIVYKEEDYSSLGEGMVSLPFILTKDGKVISRGELNKRKKGSSPNQYTVIPGDNLTKIARKLSKRLKNKVTVQDLLDKNEGLTRDSIITPKIKIRY